MVPKYLVLMTLNGHKLRDQVSITKLNIASPPVGNRVRDHSSITSSKRWVGGVRKWQFLMIYSTVNHQSWVGGPKKVKNMMT